MKALILAAGYATRLYPLTKDTPKSLLKIKNRPILDYIVDKVEEIEEIDRIFIVSNDKFYPEFSNWLNTRLNNGFRRLKLINDGSRSQEGKLGAVGDMNLAINRETINDDLLIVAGDNLFDFDLREFINFALPKRPYHSIGLYMANNHPDLTRFGIAQLHSNAEIFNFEEKPDFPKSNLIATCIYFIPKEKLYLVSKYLESGQNNDTPGSYIKWLTQDDKVYGKIFDGLWLDLGDFESLSEAVISLNGDKTRPRGVYQHE